MSSSIYLSKFLSIIMIYTKKGKLKKYLKITYSFIFMPYYHKYLIPMFFLNTCTHNTIILLVNNGSIYNNNK